MQTLSESTQRTYATQARIFQRWLNGREPTLEEGQAFLESLAEKGAKRNTIGVAGRALRKVFDLAVAVSSIEMLEPHYLSID